jgi:hypothetical protein
MSDRLTVEARGRDVVLELDGRSAVLTPREAQRFAFHLAHAYVTAAGFDRDRFGNVLLKDVAR